jgi:hypothetical protein
MEMQSYLQAQETVRKYVCATCYGHLLAYPKDDGVVVLCAKCKEDTKGYVTKRYAQRRQQESLAEKLEARQVLKDGISSPHAGKNEAQLLQELGF